MRRLCPKFSDFKASEVLFWVLVCGVVLGALSKLAIILLRKREPVACGYLNSVSFSYGTKGSSGGFPGRTQYFFLHQHASNLRNILRYSRSVIRCLIETSK